VLSNRIAFFSTQETERPNQVGPNPWLYKIYPGDSEDDPGRTVTLSFFPFLRFGPAWVLNTSLLLGNLVRAAAAASSLSSIFDLFIQPHTSFNLPNAPIQARIWPHREVLLPSALGV